MSTPNGWLWSVPKRRLPHSDHTLYDMNRLLAVACISAVISMGANDYDNRLAEGVDAFYHADWGEAETVFRELQRREPTNPKAYFFDAMVPFWQYFFGSSDGKTAQDFLSRSEKAIEVGEKHLRKAKSDTSAVLLLSGLYGYRSLVAASEKEYSTAVKSGMTGFGYTRQLLAMDEGNEDALIGKGVFQYMMGSVPKEGRWMTGIMGLSGDVETGFKELEKAADSNSQSRTDAKMILVYLYDRERRHHDALRVAKSLSDEFPENIIFRYYLARSLEHTDQKRDAANAYALVVESDKQGVSALKKMSGERLHVLEAAGYR